MEEVTLIGGRILIIGNDTLNGSMSIMDIVRLRKKHMYMYMLNGQMMILH